MPETDFLPDFTPAADHIVLEQSVPSFFIGTPLDLQLRARQIRTVVLTGVATEIGIEFTARHALALGYFVVVIEDALGSLSDQGNQTGLQHLRSFAVSASTTAVTSAWTTGAQVGTSGL